MDGHAISDPMLCRWVNTRQLSIALDVEPLDSTSCDAERMFNRFVNQDLPFKILDDLVNIGNKGAIVGLSDCLRLDMGIDH
jgi:hypothetical protein